MTLFRKRRGGDIRALQSCIVGVDVHTLLSQHGLQAFASCMRFLCCKRRKDATRGMQALRRTRRLRTVQIRTQFEIREPEMEAEFS